MAIDHRLFGDLGRDYATGGAYLRYFFTRASTIIVYHVTFPYPMYVKEPTGLRSNMTNRFTETPRQCRKKPRIYLQHISIIHRETRDTLLADYLAITGRDCFAFEVTASAACVSFSDLNFRR